MANPRLMGMEVLVSPWLPKTRWEQFRFPRSKKARMRKKWRRNPANWHHRCLLYDLWKMNGKIFVHPEMMAKLRSGIEKANWNLPGQ